MALVPVGRRVVDITVDGVELVAGDEIYYDKSYDLSTSYPARIKLNGNTRYTNYNHNQDTTYDMSVSGKPNRQGFNESGRKKTYNIDNERPGTIPLLKFPDNDPATNVDLDWWIKDYNGRGSNVYLRAYDGGNKVFDSGEIYETESGVENLSQVTNVHIRYKMWDYDEFKWDINIDFIPPSSWCGIDYNGVSEN